MDWKKLTPLFEATKEPLRLLVLAIIPFGIAYVQDLSYEWATIALVVLRFLDKLFHELGKANNNEQLTRGLTRF